MDDLDRAGVLRALRAWAGLERATVAVAAGISLRALAIAESGERCTDKTWGKLLAVYRLRGLSVSASGATISKAGG